MAIGNIDRVDAPTIIRATVVTGHPPANSSVSTEGQVHDARDKPLRVAAPCPKPRNWTPSISADRAVISAHEEGVGRNVLKRASTVSTDLQHAAIESEVGIRVRRFKIEVVPECQARVEHLEKKQVW